MSRRSSGTERGRLGVLCGLDAVDYQYTHRDGVRSEEEFLGRQTQNKYFVWPPRRVALAFKIL